MGRAGIGRLINRFQAHEPHQPADPVTAHNDALAIQLTHHLPAAVWLAPLIILVELVSFVAKPITLSVRLFANMFAGHMLIKLFGDFAAMMVDRLGAIGIVAAMAPVAMMVLFFAFEIMVVFIQSYIFILLTCVYLRSAIHPH